jgi:bacteriorhodopsin
MHLVILLLAALAFFVYLTLDARRDPEKRKLYYLYLLIDLWLGAVFVYLLVSAVLDFN